MQASDSPDRIELPFADSGTKNTIPVDSQVGITPGAASYETGFPPLTFTPLAAGGVPPSGADFNGILNAITAILQWQSAGGFFKYNADFSTAIGGYPKGAVLLNSAGTGLWMSAADNNSANPDTGGANWVLATTVPGTLNMFAGATPPPGWLECNGAAVSRTIYAALFAAIGTAWGTGDGSTTFNLPDFRDRFPHGASVANPVGTVRASSIKAHSHYLPTATGDLTDPRWVLNDPAYTGGLYEGAINWTDANSQPSSSGPGNGNAMMTLDDDETHPSLGTETRPPCAAVLFCIKF